MNDNIIDLFSGKHIIQNEGIKYSDLLNDFIKPFENDFPDEMDIEDIFSFACSAWNLGCMSLIIPKEEFKRILSENSIANPENTIFKRMIELKNKKFASYDRFIDDFSVEEKHGELVLTVITQEKEAFLASLIEEAPDNSPVKVDFEEAFVDRHAIIIKPLQPFFDWINSIYPDDPLNEVDEPNVYLVDDKIDSVEQWLKKKFDKFFIMELDEWHAEKKEWPQKRTYKMFRQWFCVEISTMVYDMENRPVYKIV